MSEKTVDELPLEKAASFHRLDERSDRGLLELLVTFGVELAADALTRLLAVEVPVLLAGNLDGISDYADGPALFRQVR